jgi:intron-binding protein aquarius
MITKKNIDPGHLVRLGTHTHSGDSEDFSKLGRINWTLLRRKQLLDIVQHLAVSIGITGDIGYSCETADYFYAEHVKQKIDKYNHDMKADGASSASLFPFSTFFGDISALSSDTFSSDREKAAYYIDSIEKVFSELKSYRVYELLRHEKKREDNILSSQVCLYSFHSN